MRIRVIQTPPIESIDGIQLDCFQPGTEYEVGNTIGALFLAEGWAEPMPLDAPAAIMPFGIGDPFDSRVLYAPQTPPHPPNLVKGREPPYLDRGIAADRHRPPKHPRPRRRRR